ncbi:b561 domain-containing protein 2 [Seminavis robusta]|uniref:B561 domain-containing protein 2 n=1 Tax=Seminavis robusta TaxID=568900 RepID=A0A9N8H2X0_9STRA|nr:b561 domain-containing protein 2 [Seminavis robusta]|eukprot:Sro75_g041050.1 b561 domain-containing protein 2 (200) ;mRNA; f:30679-31435
MPAPQRAAPATKPSATTYVSIVGFYVLYALGGGYMVATQPSGGWQQPFSWHPLLMTIGMVAFMGIGAMTKKLGGYDNTKLHAIFSWSGIFCTLGGLYAIYTNKEQMGRPHLTSWHSWIGIAAAVNALCLGLVGSIVLHPDFGVDKTNKTIRFAHKTGARLVLALAWGAAFVGLYKMTQEPTMLILYGAPLVIFAPFTLI